MYVTFYLLHKLGTDCCLLLFCLGCGQSYTCNITFHLPVLLFLSPLPLPLFPNSPLPSPSLPPSLSLSSLLPFPSPPLSLSFLPCLYFILLPPPLPFFLLPPPPHPSSLPLPPPLSSSSLPLNLQTVPGPGQYEIHS